MDIVIIGKNEAEMNSQKSMVRSIIPDSDIRLRKADDFAHMHPGSELAASDIVFLDIDSMGQNGVGLAKTISETGRINVILISSDHRYDMQAFEVRASGILYKPLLWERMKYEISNLRYPLAESKTGR